MYCSKCGSPNEKTSKFCMKCGAELLAPAPPQAKPAASTPVPGTQQGQGPVVPPQAGIEPAQAGKKTSPGSWVSLGGAIVVLLLFFAPWASCGGDDLSGLNLIVETEGDLAWVAIVPFCAVAALGILYALRRQLVVSAWARIATAIGGLIPMIKLYADYSDSVDIKWGSIGTVVGLAAMLLGGVQDLITEMRKKPR